MNILHPITTLGLKASITETGSIKIQGLSKLPHESAETIIEYTRANKPAIVAELSKGYQIEPMIVCLHTRPCPHLRAPGEIRPECRLAGESPFDLLSCPAGHWQTITYH